MYNFDDSFCRKILNECLVFAIVLFLFIFIFSWTALEAEDKASMILITGAPGTEEYEKTFNEWAAQWKEAAGKGEAKFSEAVHTEEKNQKERLSRSMVWSQD